MNGKSTERSSQKNSTNKKRPPSNLSSNSHKDGFGILKEKNQDSNGKKVSMQINKMFKSKNLNQSLKIGSD